MCSGLRTGFSLEEVIFVSQMAHEPHTGFWSQTMVTSKLHSANNSASPREDGLTSERCILHSYNWDRVTQIYSIERIMVLQDYSISTYC